MQRIAWILICLSILSLSCDKNKNNTVTPQVKIGELVPEIELTNLEGTKISLSNYSGSVMLLEFWATWCPDCKEVLPQIQTLYETSKSTGYSVVTVSVDTKPEIVHTFMNENRYSFEVLHGGPQVREHFAIKAIPTLYFIDRTGIIRASLVEYGSRGAEEVDRLLKKLLDEQ